METLEKRVDGRNDGRTSLIRIYSIPFPLSKLFVAPLMWHLKAFMISMSYRSRPVAFLPGESAQAAPIGLAVLHGFNRALGARVK